MAEKTNLNEIIRKIQNDNILLPDFQRGFVWKDEEMQKKLAESETLPRPEQEGCNLQILKRKERIDAIEKEIASLLDKITAANDTVMAYINNRSYALDAEKKDLYAHSL